MIPKTTLLLDWYNLINRVAFATINQYPEDNYDFELTKHNLLNSFYSIVQHQSFDRFIVCIDSKNSWRYEIYPNYKANRKDTKVTLNKERLFPIINDLVEDMKKIFPNIMFMKVNRAEADDIIGVLAKEISSTNNEVIIYSRDSDFYQLLQYKGVRMFDPDKLQFIECLNPIKALEAKIIGGDTNDNIKGIKHRIGTKTKGAEKILKEGLEAYFEEYRKEEPKVIRTKYKEKKLQEYLNLREEQMVKIATLGLDEVMEELIEDSIKTIKKNYYRNTKLIDFNCIPEDIKTEIIKNYLDYDLKPMYIKQNKTDRYSFDWFFKKHNLYKLYCDWSNVGKLFERLG